MNGPVHRAALVAVPLRPWVLVAMLSQQLLRRRDFFRLGAACAGLHSAGMRAAAPAADGPQLGFSLYAMKQLPLSDALRHCRDIGYRAVELALMPGWPAEPAVLTADARRALRAQLGDLELHLAALMENLPLLADEAQQRANLDRLRRAAELALDLVPERPPLIETVLGGRPAEWNRVKRQMADRLGRWAEIADAQQVMLAVKPHVSGALHTPEDARWLLQQVNHPRVRLVYDYSHYALRGYDLAETLRQLLPVTVFVHVKDAAGDPARVQFLLPGDAPAGPLQVDYATYFRLLAAGGYRGAVVVEVSAQLQGQPGYDPLQAARRSYQNMSSALDSG